MNYEQWKRHMESKTQKDLLDFYHSPKAFCLQMIPWGLGELKNEFLRDWQLEYLEDWGKEIVSRGFTGTDSVKPIMMSTASGHGVGKSALCAFKILFLHYTRPRSKGMVTAGTRTQLKERTWSELKRWMRLNPLFDKISEYSNAANNMSLRNKSDPSGWNVVALTVEAHSSENFQGLHAHASSPFIIVDEASAIDDAIYTAARWGVSSGEGHLAIFGNLTRPSGFFQRSQFSEKDMWNARSISRTDVFPDNEADKEEIKKYGWDSDYIRVRIRGLPPKLSESQLISWDDIDQCIETNLQYQEDDPLIFGIDMGSTGVDKTVIFPVKGAVADLLGHPIEIMDTNDIPSMEQRIAERIHMEKPDHVWVDSTGHGAGSVQHLQQMGFRQVRGVNFARKVEGTNYANMRSYMYGRLHRKIMNGMISLPDNMRLRDELGAITYTERSSDGKILLDPKSEIKKKLGRSPDMSDALALTQAFVVPKLSFHNENRVRSIVRI